MPPPPIEERAEPSPAASVPPRWRRVGFWRGVAGMAISVALACVIVTGEFSSALFRANAHYRRRISYLASRISRLRSEIASSNRQTAAVREENLAHAQWGRILAAPDARFIRLAPVNRTDSAAGLLIVSLRRQRAMLQVNGLPSLSAGRCYGLWWLPAKGAPLKAAHFNTDSKGEAIAPALLPPRDGRITALVTIETGAASTVAASGVKLKGVAILSASHRVSRLP